MVAISAIAFSAEAGFFDERYRGWFWFEEGKKIKVEKMSPEVASKEIEYLKNELDNRRNVMIAQPNAENVKDYIVWEEKMWRNALKLDEAYREAKFLYPEYFDKRKNPTNVHAVKLRRASEREQNINKIREFAQKFDLVVVTKEDCLYSKAFAPILKGFAKEYGFQVSRIEKDVSSNTPITYAYSKNGKKKFELVRGFVSKSELEEYALLAINYADI